MESLVWPYAGSRAIRRSAAQTFTKQDYLWVEAVGYFPQRDMTGLGPADAEIDSVVFTTDDMLAANIAHLRRMPNLRTLSLRGTVSDCGMQALAKVQGVNDVILEIFETNVSDEGLRSLHACPWVRAIWLNGPPITDEGIRIITQLENVTAVGLLEEPVSRTRITDKSVAAIADMKQIKHLTIDSPNVTDASVPALASMPNLRSLTLTGTAVTNSGIEHLKNELTGCTVSRTFVGWETTQN